MNGLNDSDSLSNFGGIIVPSYPDDEEDVDVDIEPSEIIDDKEYLRRTFKLCPKFVEEESDVDNGIYHEEIQGHVLGALMATSSLIEEGGVSAHALDQNLSDITNRFITLKRIASVLEESDAAQKNIEIVLRNPIFRNIIEEVSTVEGIRFKPVEKSSIGELLVELRRCFKKKAMDIESKIQKKKREMELPENKIRRMHGRNFLVDMMATMMNMQRNEQNPHKIKWQALQTLYTSVREPDHPLHLYLYVKFAKQLNLDEYPQLEQKANKHIFGKSKTTNFLAIAEFNEIVEYSMVENQLYINFKEPFTEEYYDSIIYDTSHFEAVQKRYDDLQAQIEERRDYSQRNFKKKRGESSHSKKETCLPTATATYVQRLAQRNMEEDTLFDSNNLNTPFGTEAPKPSELELSSDEDDILSEKCFSDEDEEVRRQKEERKQQRKEAIAAKEQRKQQKREEQRLLMQDASASRDQVPSEDKNVTVHSESNKQQEEDQYTVKNKWESTINEPLKPVVEVAKYPRTYSHSNPTIQPLFGLGNDNNSNRNRTPAPTRIDQSKSFFGGPSDLSASPKYQREMNNSITNHFENFNVSKPVNDGVSKISPAYSSPTNVISAETNFSVNPSPYPGSMAHSYPLERLSSSCSVASQHRSEHVEENKMKFLNFLKSHVRAFSSEKSRNMRLLSNISESLYGHPSRLFGSKYLDVIQSYIPQIHIEDVETEDGYEILFQWVEQ